MPDLFSSQSDLYSRYRPRYPQELYDHILQFVRIRNRAWDCATGNGQAAIALAAHFKQVDASDISAAQLAKAVPRPNIQYHLSNEYQTPFPNDSFDLITVAQAYHWLDTARFFTEATRVGRHEAVVAVWMYDLPTAKDNRLQDLLSHFYLDITGPYWDAARKHVDEKYRSLPFDFNPLPSKDLTIHVEWTAADLRGYLSSWSAVQSFIKKKNFSPLQLIESELGSIWPNEEPREFKFPLVLRLGRIIK